MFDCMEALGMGPRQLYDVTSRGACMLRKASPFFAGLDPFAWTGSASVQCKWHPICIYSTTWSISASLPFFFSTPSAHLFTPQGSGQRGVLSGATEPHRKGLGQTVSSSPTHLPHSPQPVWAAQPSERISLLWYDICTVSIDVCVSEHCTSVFMCGSAESSFSEALKWSHAVWPWGCIVKTFHIIQVRESKRK